MFKERDDLIVKGVGLSEIFILVFAVFAFAFFVGGVGIVNARPDFNTLPNDFKLYNEYRGTKIYRDSANGNMLYKGNDGYYLYQDEAINSFNSILGGSNNPSTTNILPNSVPNSVISKTFDFTNHADLDLPGIGVVNAKTTADGLHAAFEDKVFELKDGVWKSSGSRYYKKGLFGLIKTGDFLYGNLYEGLTWSLAAVSAIQLVGGMAGLDPGVTKALSIAAVAGIMGGKAVYGLWGEGGGSAVSGQGILGQSLSSAKAGMIGVAIAAVVFALMYKKTSTKEVTFECLPWEAPLGGDNCEVCNGDPLKPCSEYRCKSLGQACDLVNKGTVEEKCVWVNPNDVTAPIIQPWDEPLTKGHEYKNHDKLPPSLGAKIVRSPDNCIQAYTQLEFGIVTNEPAQCKIDTNHTDKLDDMNYYFGDSFYEYNHTETLSLPDSSALKDALNGTESPEIPTDGIYNFYTRCRDANGNENTQEFVFQLCVDPSPDTTPPVIVDTSIQSGSYVSFGSDNVNMSVYVNEPSNCKWDLESKSYDEMSDEMSCSTEIYEMNAQQLYQCSTTLTGIKDREENKFYFRCKDQPNKDENERNVNTQSYEFSLWGSQPLNIDEVGPNGTVYGSTGFVNLDLTAKTSNGAEEGKAICYFSDTGKEGSYVSMFDTDSFEHKQILSLAPGDYEYFFRCVDAGGNSAENSTEFSVFVDEEAPQITRAYREDGLKIVTDEDADCVYSLNSCNYAFDEGLKMIYSNPSIRTNHFAEWTNNLIYYIKCSDDYGNQPAPNECSLIASASNVK